MLVLVPHTDVHISVWYLVRCLYVNILVRVRAQVYLRDRRIFGISGAIIGDRQSTVGSPTGDPLTDNLRNLFHTVRFSSTIATVPPVYFLDAV